MEFVEGSQGIEQHCHSEPVRTLVWESPSNSRQPIVIQTALFAPFSGVHPREIVLLSGRLPRQCALLYRNDREFDKFQFTCIPEMKVGRSVSLPQKSCEPLSVLPAAQKEVHCSYYLYLSACFMDRLMRWRFSSTDRTMTFTTSPTFTASLGWRRRRPHTSEMCTRPS